jgi:hypothetical protein
VRYVAHPRADLSPCTLCVGVGVVWRHEGSRVPVQQLAQQRAALDADVERLKQQEEKLQQKVEADIESMHARELAIASAAEAVRYVLG